MRLREPDPEKILSHESDPKRTKREPDPEKIPSRERILHLNSCLTYSSIQ